MLTEDGLEDVLLELLDADPELLLLWLLLVSMFFDGKKIFGLLEARSLLLGAWSSTD